MMLLYRHGARYPTTGALPGTFAQKVINATKAGGFNASGELAFLSTWQYKLGAELLTPFGRSQNFELGVAYRQMYGELLNNFTEAGTLPVFRTQSQDRMVKTAENFAAGFFGVPEYLDQVSIEIIVESPGVNNSGAAYEVCPNANIAARGSIGSTVATQFAASAFNSTLARLNSEVSSPRPTSWARLLTASAGLWRSQLHLYRRPLHAPAVLLRDRRTRLLAVLRFVQRAGLPQL